MGNTIKTIGEALESVFGDNPNGNAERTPTINRNAPVRFSTIERASSPVQSNTTGYSAGYSTASSTNTSQGNRAGYTVTNHSNGISSDYSTQSPTNYWAGNSTTNAEGYSNTSRYSTGHVTSYSTATSSISTAGHSRAHPVVAPSRFPNDYSTAYPPSGTRASSSGQGIITTPSSTTSYSNATSSRDSTGYTSVYLQRTNSTGISTGYSTGYTREVPSGYSAATETAYTTGRQTINSTTTQQPVERSWHSATSYATDHARVTANDYDSDDEDTDGTFDDSEEEFEEENLVEFYHYTDFAGICAIQSYGYIKESSEDTMYAQHGRGVYGTNMAPCEGKLAISINNWNNGGYARMRRGRADYAVRLLIPESKVKDCSTRRRDLLLHKGLVFLRDYEYEIICVEHE